MNCITSKIPDEIWYKIFYEIYKYFSNHHILLHIIPNVCKTWRRICSQNSFFNINPMPPTIITTQSKFNSWDMSMYNKMEIFSKTNKLTITYDDRYSQKNNMLGKSFLELTMSVISKYRWKSINQLDLQIYCKLSFGSLSLLKYLISVRRLFITYPEIQDTDLYFISEIPILQDLRLRNCKRINLEPFIRIYTNRLIKQIPCQRALAIYNSKINFNIIDLIKLLTNCIRENYLNFLILHKCTFTDTPNLYKPAFVCALEIAFNVFFEKFKDIKYINFNSVNCLNDKILKIISTNCKKLSIMYMDDNIKITTTGLIKFINDTPSLKTISITRINREVTKLAGKLCKEKGIRIV